MIHDQKNTDIGIGSDEEGSKLVLKYDGVKRCAGNEHRLTDVNGVVVDLCEERKVQSLFCCFFAEGRLVGQGLP